MGVLQYGTPSEPQPLAWLATAVAALMGLPGLSAA